MAASNVPASTLARLFGITERRVQQLAKDGVIPRGAKGEYPFLPSIKGYIQFLQQAAASRADVGSEDIIRHRTRYEATRADMNEIDLAERRGQLIHIDDMRDEVSAMLMNFRARVLAIPPAVAAQGTGLKKPELEKLTRTKVNEALHELSGYDPEPAKRTKGNQGSGGKRKAAAGDKRQRVGGRGKIPEQRK